MLNYLDIKTVKSSPQIYLSQWPAVNKKIIKNIDDVMYKYKTQVEWLSTSNILVQFLIKYTNQIETYNDYDFFDYIKDHGYYTSSSFGFTTAFNGGAIHYGDFYGKDNEVVIAYNSNLTVEDLRYNWEDYSPLNVLRHNFNNIDYGQLDGKDDSYGGLTMFSFDFTGFLIQYRLYREYEKRQIASGELLDRITTAAYVFSYPLTNALKSHVACSVANIFMEDHLPITYYQRESRRRRAVMDVEPEIRKLADEWDDQLSKKRWSMEYILNTMPMPFYTNVLTFLDHPNDIILNRQNAWAYFLAKIPYLIYSIKINPEFKSYNSTTLARFKVLSKQMKADNTWKRGVFTSIRQTIKDELEMFESVL